MTAVPKHWPSSRRQGKRRATIKKGLTKITVCSACGKNKRPTFACPSCGKTSKEAKSEK